MFYEWNNLVNIDLSSLNLKSLKDMSKIFSWSNNLVKIDLSSLDLEKCKIIENIYELF